jgi:hypothetical protein
MTKSLQWRLFANAFTHCTVVGFEDAVLSLGSLHVPGHQLLSSLISMMSHGAMCGACPESRPHLPEVVWCSELFPVSSAVTELSWQRNSYAGVHVWRDRCLWKLP